MIVAVDIPEGGKAVVKNGRVFIIFDENKIWYDLWIANFYIWLTSGNTYKDFGTEELLSAKSIFVTKNKKFKVANAK